MQSSKEKILIFGGSFNPFHFGHLEILKQAEMVITPDKIFIVPSAYNYKDNVQDEYISNADRIKILDLTLNNKKNCFICDFEIKNSAPTYTYKTIDYFLHQFNDAELYLLIGADQWAQFHTWKEYKHILNNAKIIVAKRNDIEINNPNLSAIAPIIIPGLNYEISSTLIRTNPKPFFVPDSVLQYINDNGLYAITRIHSIMSEHRFQHSLRVAFMCKELMEKFDNTQTRLAYTSGIYHDIAKELNFDQQVDIAENILGIYNYGSPKVLHGYIGAYFLQKNYFFTNKKILNAICRHTKPYDYYCNEPTLLDKILYLADKLEPHRTNDDVFGEDIESFRKLAFSNPNECFEKLLNLIQSKIQKK